MISKLSRDTILMGFIALMLSGETASAQFPNWKAKPVRPRIDVIPPLGNNLPYSYRARMNRPTYLGGRISYTIEPTSQEAMAWQRAWERGYYNDHAPRTETRYMFPKPWEVLGVNAKPKRGEDVEAIYPQPERLPLGPADDEPVTLEKLDTPEAESPELRDSRQQVDAPDRLEIAPAIELSPSFRVE